MGTICAKLVSNDAADGPTVNSGDMNKRDAISVDDDARRRRRAAYDSIVLSARNALQQMERYGEEFVTSRFGTSLAAHHMEWMEQRYTWFVSAEDVPKNLNESLAETVLATLDVDAVLRMAQNLLQKMKIALDRIASDLHNADGDLVDNFLQSRDFVNAVVYEVTSAMREFQIPPHPPVPSDFMPASVVSADQSAMRDWFLYRECRNTLEYIIQVFSNFSTQDSQ